MRNWTEKDRKRQACVARRNRPWKNSTGPKTAEGKERCKMNAWKGGLYTEDYRTIRNMLMLNRIFLANVFAFSAAERRREALRNRTVKE